MTKEKIRGVSWQITAYIFAYLVATIVFRQFELEEVWKLLIANVAATAVIFFFAFAFKNSSFYDPYWSVQPIVLALYLIVHEQFDVNIARQTVAFLIILTWGLRLTLNFLRTWSNVYHEDWRYTRLREQTGKWFPLVNFFGIMLFPTILVYMGCIPLFDVLKESSAPFGIWDIIATIVGITGILFELVADNQLHRFIKTREDHSKIINTGLWKYSRHPNYFGEILFWVSLSLFSIGAVDDLEWYNSIGMISMILLFNFISIPMQEKRLIERKPHYKREQEIRSKIIPLPPKE